jgi:mRNA interferase MazF
MPKRPSYTPQRGDIVMLSFSPQAGHEQGGHRPALVISPAAYNEASGLAFCCPITRTRRQHPFEVALPKGLLTTGVVLVEHLRSLAWRERMAAFVEAAPGDLVAEVAGKAIAIIGG